MPKKLKIHDSNYPSHQRWSTRIRRKPDAYTPPGRDVPQLQKREYVPTREEVFKQPPETVCVPPDYCPSPIVVGVLKRKQTETPPVEKKQKHDCARFLYGSFGHGFQNEQRHTDNPFYAYWNRYGRSDLQAPSAFETHCFLCHGSIGFGGCKEETDTGRTDLDHGIAICGVFGCPKIYHKNCLDTYFWEGNPDSEHWICPRHYCNRCESLYLLNYQHCPTCPYSTCGFCLGDSYDVRIKSWCHKPKENEVMCQACKLTAENLNAPEMLMSLRTLR